MKGMSKRAAIVIGQDQTIRYYWVTDDSSQKPDPDAVIACLRTL